MTVFFSFSFYIFSLNFSFGPTLQFCWKYFFRRNLMYKKRNPTHGFNTFSVFFSIRTNDFWSKKKLNLIIQKIKLVFINGSFFALKKRLALESHSLESSNTKLLTIYFFILTYKISVPTLRSNNLQLNTIWNRFVSKNKWIKGSINYSNVSFRWPSKPTFLFH